ncbi:cytidine deaminase [Hydrogenimonas sp.]|uniref:cytidine deaminase n=1 Tax=Hydrogenimonas sp. TaxID=2231112 RepID=UPI00260B6014|nr:cytidine deaminase [Hydrogenimonas sp.]
MNRFDELDALLKNAYAPYSGFRVASVMVTKEGSLFQGVNVESVAYPTTMCAERNAIFHAVSEGAKPGDVAEVHILAKNSEGKYIEAFPCGACRQIIAELSLNEAKIYVYRSNDEISVHSISELLPHAFFSLT